MFFSPLFYLGEKSKDHIVVLGLNGAFFLAWRNERLAQKNPENALESLIFIMKKELTMA